MKNLILLVATITLTFLCLSCSNKEETKLVAACNLPLTGGLATYGESIRDGVLLAIDDMEKKLGKDSIYVKFLFDDNQGEPKNTVSIFQKQTTSKIDFYISAVTPQTMSIIQQVQQKGIPHFAWAWQPFITRDYNNTFRTWVNFEAEAEHYIGYIIKKKPTKVAIAHMNVTGPLVQFSEIVIPEMTKLGITNYQREIFNLDKTDFKDIANKFKDYNPDLILMSGFKEHVIGFVRACREVNLFRNGNAMISMDLLDASENISNVSLEGLVLTVPKFLVDKSEYFQDWVNKFNNKYNRLPRYTDAYAYDMALIINNASKRFVNSKASDGKKIIEYLMETNLEGITGPLRFKDNRDLKLELKTCFYKEGKLIPKE